MQTRQLNKNNERFTRTLVQATEPDKTVEVRILLITDNFF